MKDGSGRSGNSTPRHKQEAQRPWCQGSISAQKTSPQGAKHDGPAGPRPARRTNTTAPGRVLRGRPPAVHATGGPAAGPPACSRPDVRRSYLLHRQVVVQVAPRVVVGRLPLLQVLHLDQQLRLGRRRAVVGGAGGQAHSGRHARRVPPGREHGALVSGGHPQRRAPRPEPWHAAGDGTRGRTALGDTTGQQEEERAPCQTDTREVRGTCFWKGGAFATRGRLQTPVSEEQGRLQTPVSEDRSGPAALAGSPRPVSAWAPPLLGEGHLARCRPQPRRLPPAPLLVAPRFSSSAARPRHPGPLSPTGARGHKAHRPQERRDHVHLRGQRTEREAGKCDLQSRSQRMHPLRDTCVLGEHTCSAVSASLLL